MLFALSRQEGVNQAGLADYLEVETITLCRMVDRLADAGLVERRADPADRRAWRLFLTDAARPLLGQLRAVGEAVIDDGTSGDTAGDPRSDDRWPRSAARQPLGAGSRHARKNCRSRMMLDRTDPAALDRIAAPRTLWQRARRPLLMLLVPLLIVGGGAYLWFTGGRSVSTDNAYVQQDKVSISADITGRVVKVNVGESQAVKRGDMLFTLDPEPFRIVLEEREAALAQARQQAAQAGTSVTGKGADMAGRRDAVKYAELDFARQAQLLKDGFTTRARYQQADLALQQARSAYDSAQADLANARAAVARGPIDRQPVVMAALAARDRAALDLRRTVVRAPSDGIASQTDKVQTGQIVAMGLPTLSLVLSDRRWVEANFKETDLEHMRRGQPATIKLDAFPGTPVTGHVLSVGAGTGSEFSVLPAQNATGNWVKVVQRVPVRIAIDGNPKVPLLAGLSATVTVDIRGAR